MGHFSDDLLSYTNADAERDARDGLPLPTFPQAPRRSPLLTVHGSALIEQSAIFACRHCEQPMAYVRLPGGDTALECTSRACGWTCGLDAADACHVQDDLVLAGQAVIAAQRAA